VRILADEQRGVLKVPNAAFRFRPAPDPTVTHAATRGSGAGRKQDIYVLGDDGKPRAVSVQPGLTDGNFTSIAAGDEREGMRVILAASGPKSAPASGNTTPGRPRGPGF